MRTICQYGKGLKSAFVWLHVLALSLFIAGCAQPHPEPTARKTTDASAETPTYREPYRPQFHFSPPADWMNDPNGMVWFDGEYHLFYQHYPDDTVWGPMHWGHAISTDLVYWEHMPIALYPDEKGYIFSGSAVFDGENRSGLGTESQPPLVAIFTYHSPELAKLGTGNHEYQGIAWSTDRGRNWTKYAGNPVLPNRQNLKDFRDPKAFWHEASQQWVVALSANDHVQLWGSENLIEWRHLSDFGRNWGAHGGVWECPDLIEMPVEGTVESRWTLIVNLNPGGPQGGSGTQYFVGDFNGERFTLDDSFKADLLDEGAIWLDSGRDSYAGVTWSNVPDEDGRNLFIGWMSNWNYAQQVPTHPWRSAMTLPRQLTLHRTGNGLRVFSQPVAELNKLRGDLERLPSGSLTPGSPIVSIPGFSLMQSEAELNFLLPVGFSGEVGFELSNDQGELYRFSYRAAVNAFFSDRRLAGDTSFSESFAGIHKTSRLSDDRRLSLRFFVDAASIEIFTDDGANVMTETFFPRQPYRTLRAFATQPGAEFSGGTVHALGSIWSHRVQENSAR